MSRLPRISVSFRKRAILWRPWASLAGFVLLAIGCGKSELKAVSISPEQRPIHDQALNLVDATRESGIGFVHTHGGSGRKYIVEAISAGLATFDYDGDGLIDIYFVNGAPLPGAASKDVPRNALYRNVGACKFIDVTEQAGVGDPGHGLGATVGDFDNDGDPDLYVTNYGPNVLYRNNGDGTFHVGTGEAGVQDGDKVSAGGCFLDIEGDGDLDLYSSNYVKFSYESHPQRVIGGVLRAPSPLDFAPEPDSLFQNNGDGTFSDVSESSGVRRQAGRGMGIIAGDFDNDRDTDVFICNDVMANFLLRNDGQGNFENVALSSGVAYGFWGKANGNMGVDCADYDNDGWFDLAITTYQAEMPVLHRNLQSELFEDVAIRAGFGTECLPHVKWGIGFADFENDGDRDLFVANGHLEEDIRLIDDSTDYRVANTLYLNEGRGRFREVSKQSGSGMAVVASSRGAAFDDLDNDGDTDVVVLNALDKPTLLRNDSRRGHWIQLALRGTSSNRDGVGARVKLISGQLSQIEEVRSGRGYQSHFGSRLHFGLAANATVDRIEIQWPSGAVSALENVPANQRLTVVEGENVPAVTGRS